MEFNIDNYKGLYVMHCKTKEEARDFCNYLYSIGKNWCSGDSYYWQTNYHTYQDKTCYNFNEGSFSNIYFYKGEGFKILEWSDFMKKKEFTKKDLKTGDVIMRRSGDVEIVNRELNTFITKTSWNNFDNIRDDLTSTLEKAWDIVKVRRPIEKGDCQFCAIKEGFGKLVYERKEVEEMTLAEVCRLLGKEIKIVK